MIKKVICNVCKFEFLEDELDNNDFICPYCGHYMFYYPKTRILSLADKDTFVEWNTNVKLTALIDDMKYIEKVKHTGRDYGINDAILTGEIDIIGMHVAIAVMDIRFMMGSMGYIVGEKVALMFEQATQKKIPVIIFCCSGGARVQEGIVSLMQMSKTVAAVKRHSNAGLLYISVLTDPTMGGVFASFATSADIILAEKYAMVGFAGSRIAEQNVGIDALKNYQTVEFQKEHGCIDKIVDRKQVREYISEILLLHDSKRRVCWPGKINIRYGESKKTKKSNGWEALKIARMAQRPSSLDYIMKLFNNFIEFHGDRISGDDKSIVGGIANFHGCTVTIIGQERGKKSLDEAVRRNWGMTSPGGFRKALRLMKQAEKFHRPIICFIDTMGAACGIEAEAEGQAASISHNLFEMISITTPILAVIVGEGASGGALALAVANEVWMLENSIYSVITPESYASIIWKDNSRVYDAVQVMKFEANDLLHLGIIDKVIKEDEMACIHNFDRVCDEIAREIYLFIVKYSKLNKDEIVSRRYKKYRKI